MLDLACTVHICSQRSHLNSFQEMKGEIGVGNMETVTSEGLGAVQASSKVTRTECKIE